MAELRRSDGTSARLLLNQHLIGRGPECALRLSGAYVSAQHALIRWHGRAWELLDRGSRNGTQLDGAAVEPGRPYRLSKGSTVSFGHPDESWIMADLGEPETMVVALDTGEALLGTQGIVGLPSSKEPECTLFLDVDGSWKLETPDGSVAALGDGETIDCGGRRFRFCLPTASDATASIGHFGLAEPGTLHFSVSLDEEFVELELEYSSRRVPLGSRAHNYLLLTLARKRLEDAAAELPVTSCGWMDKEELAEGLKMTPQQIDGEVFRIRKHFSQHGLKEAATIVERRPRTKQIRLGIESLRIDRR
jgi:FHA domain